MATNFRISNVAAKAMADTFDDHVNIGSTAAAIDVRSGAQPADRTPPRPARCSQRSP